MGSAATAAWRGALLLCCGLLARGAAADALLVTAAASLRDAVGTLAARYEAGHPGLRVDTGFGASSFLAAQIRAGAPVDVFVSADAGLVAELAVEGRVLLPAPFARNRLVVMAAPGAPPLAAPEDLAGPAVRRIAVPGGAVPVGRYARAWLASRGLLARLAPRLVETEHARATLAAVDLGHADAAIVYATDARVARAARLAFEVPAAEQPEILYAAALVAGARPGAAELLAFLLGPEASRVLAEAGFGAP